MNVKEIIDNAIQLALGENQADPEIDTPLYVGFFNKALNELFNDTCENNPDLDICEVFENVDFSLTYNLGNTPHKVKYVVDPNLPPSYTPLNLSQYQINKVRTNPNNIKAFYIKLNNINFINTIDNQNIICVTYTPRCPTLTIDSLETEIPCPIDHQFYLIYGTLKWAFIDMPAAKQNLTVGNSLAEWTRGLDKIKLFLSNNFLNSPNNLDPRYEPISLF